MGEEVAIATVRSDWGLWPQWPSAVQGAVFYPLGGQGHPSQCWPESGPAPWLAWPQPWPRSYRWQRHRATGATVAPTATPAHSCTMLSPPLRAGMSGQSRHSGEIQQLLHNSSKFGDISNKCNSCSLFTNKSKFANRNPVYSYLPNPSIRPYFIPIPLLP